MPRFVPGFLAADPAERGVDGAVGRKGRPITASARSTCSQRARPHGLIVCLAYLADTVPADYAVFCRSGPGCGGTHLAGDVPGAAGLALRSVRGGPGRPLAAVHDGGGRARACARRDGRSRQAPWRCGTRPWSGPRAGRTVLPEGPRRRGGPRCRRPTRRRGRGCCRRTSRCRGNRPRDAFQNVTVDLGHAASTACACGLSPPHGQYDEIVSGRVQGDDPGGIAGSYDDAARCAVSEILQDGDPLGNGKDVRRPGALLVSPLCGARGRLRGVRGPTRLARGPDRSAPRRRRPRSRSTTS